MKSISTLIAILLLSVAFLQSNRTQAQVPKKMSYQAVVRGIDNSIIASKSIGMQISILKNSVSGTEIYVERHFPITSDVGLVSIEIGAGTVVSGDFSAIGWADGTYYIKTETDLNGGSNYTMSGTSQLLSVPYALHAGTVEIDSVNDADADPENEIQTLTLTGRELSISNGNSVTLPPADDADADPSNEIQTLAISGNNLTINKGNTVALPVPTPSPWSNIGTTLTYSLGNVEIGTTSAPSILRVKGSSLSIYGETSTGYAVYGLATSLTGYTYGGFFETKANTGKAVYGLASSTTGANVGGYFTSKSNEGAAVLALASSITGLTRGGYFITSSENGRAVEGTATNNSGVNFGGHFTASSSTGYGVWASGGLYDFYAAGAGANFGASSSIRWKNNIIAIDNPLQKIDLIRGIYFDWDNEHGGKHDIGVIAEEIGKVLPEIVVYEENGIDAMGVDYSKITPLLIEAIKAQQKQIEELTERIELLEGN